MASGAKNGPTQPCETDKNVCPTEDVITPAAFPTGTPAGPPLIIRKHSPQRLDLYAGEHHGRQLQHLYSPVRATLGRGERHPGPGAVRRLLEGEERHRG